MTGILPEGSGGYIPFVAAISVAIIGALGSWFNNVWSRRRAAEDKSSDKEYEHVKVSVEADVEARLNLYKANEYLIKAYRQERDQLLERVGRLSTLVESLLSDKAELLARLGQNEIQVGKLMRESDETKAELIRCHQGSAELEKRCAGLQATVSTLQAQVEQHIRSSN